MTKKSQNRRQKDAERRAANGGKAVRGTFDREKSSRCWYQLKEVHMRSAGYIEKTASLFSQYRHKTVLLKIAKNGDADRFNELQSKIPAMAEAAGKQFLELWQSHESKKKLCLSYNELAEAIRIFEAYQTFDIDFFNTFQPVIGELNAIYNKALGQLLEAQDQLAIEATERGEAAAVTDVVYKEEDRAQEVQAPVEGLGDIAKEEPEYTDPSAESSVHVGEGVEEFVEKIIHVRGENPAFTPIDELGVKEEELNIDPRMGHDLIRINV